MTREGICSRCKQMRTLDHPARRPYWCRDCRLDYARSYHTAHSRAKPRRPCVGCGTPLRNNAKACPVCDTKRPRSIFEVRLPAKPLLDVVPADRDAPWHTVLQDSSQRGWITCDAADKITTYYGRPDVLNQMLELVGL